MTWAAVIAVPVTVAAWWLSTGVILWLDRQSPRTYPLSVGAATLLALLAAWGLVATRDEPSIPAAYLAFACAVAIWGWLEMTFLMGYVRGPRKHACAPGCHGPAHFRHAVEAILYHELAILGAGALLLAATLGHANEVGGWSFAVLWVMRVSAKLNLFLGVPNVGERFLPEHLRYLESFFARRRGNLLFPVVVTAGTALTVWLARQAWLAADGSFDAVAYTLVATLLGLAVLEHWLMVLPLRPEALWGLDRAVPAAAGASLAPPPGEHRHD